MRLIIGGAYQGKLNYAVEKYKKNVICDGNTCTLEDTYFCEIINNFNELIKRFFTNLESFIVYLNVLLTKNPNIIVISTEIGCGIVPIKKSDRDYRELVGRACCEISKRSESVERVFCGLGVVLK